MLIILPEVLHGGERLGRIESSWRKQTVRSIKPKEAEKTGLKWPQLQCNRIGNSLYENSRGL